MVSPPPTRPDIKISEAILTLAEPLRTQYREPHRMQVIISLAVMAWNIALFPDEEQSHVQGMLLERLPPQLGGEDVGVLLSTIDTLVAPHQTVVTMHTTVQSGVAVPVKDAHAVSVVPNEIAAHETTAVRTSSSNGR